MWRLTELLSECAVPAVAGIAGSFVGIGIARWLGIL